MSTTAGCRARRRERLDIERGHRDTAARAIHGKAV
jgi:hypothetical protein